VYVLHTLREHTVRVHLAREEQHAAVGAGGPQVHAKERVCVGVVHGLYAKHPEGVSHSDVCEHGPLRAEHVREQRVVEVEAQGRVGSAAITVQERAKTAPEAALGLGGAAGAALHAGRGDAHAGTAGGVRARRLCSETEPGQNVRGLRALLAISARGARRRRAVGTRWARAARGWDASGAVGARAARLGRERRGWGASGRAAERVGYRQPLHRRDFVQ